MVRTRPRRPRRSTVLFVEAVLAVVVVGIAFRSVGGYVVAGLAVLVGIVGLVRRRGRSLVDVALDRLRDSPPAPAEPGPDLGDAGRLVPGLHVAEVRTRDGGGVGVAGDGQGFVTVLDADGTALADWALADVLGLVLDDPARPAAVQVLVEQHGPAAAADPAFGPSRTYRSLPVGGLPLWTRVLLAVRHEPAWAPETVASRGGGATGARNALAAVAGRVAAGAARTGARLRPLDAAELTALLRNLAAPRSGTAGDVVLAVPPTGDDTLGAVLRALAELGVERGVLAVTASAVDHTLSAVVRVTDPRGEVVERAVAQLVDDGLARRLPGADDGRRHAAGVVATLPLGGGARSLADVVAQVRR